MTLFEFEFECADLEESVADVETGLTAAEENIQGMIAL